MNILENINKRIKKEKIDYVKPTEKQINELKEKSTVPLPDDYISLLTVGSSITFLIESLYYFSMWSHKDTIELNKEYNVQKYIPNALVIGTNLGDGMICYCNGNLGFGLYIVEDGDMDIDSCIFIAKSITDFLVDGVGIDIYIENNY